MIRTTPHFRSRRQSGTALLIALAVTIILVSMLAVTVSSQRAAILAESTRMAQRRTRMIAMDAAQLAIQAVMEGASGLSSSSSSSASSVPSSVTTSVSMLQDDWATLGQTGAVKYVVGPDSFRIQVVDTCGFVDINQTNAAWLMNMGLTQEEADCINDWRNTGETPASDGAKDSYYNALANPYNAKLGRVDTPDELLAVKDITPDVFFDSQTSSGTVTLQANDNGVMPALYDLITAYAFAPNTTATGTARTNVNTSNAQALQRLGISPATANALRPVVRPPTWTSFGQIFTTIPNMSQADERAVLNNLGFGAATQTEGLININTASQNVLSTIPNVTPDIAQAIVAQQQSGFATLGAIVSIPGVSNQLLRTLASRICIASTTFEARVIATAGPAETAYTVIVQVTAGVPKIVSLTEAPFPASQMMARWGWQGDTTSEQDLVQPS